MKPEPPEKSDFLDLVNHASRTPDPTGRKTQARKKPVGYKGKKTGQRRLWF